ncbi:MAG: carboxypeptidase regulatory-like domain-containing protein, partial [Vicinamibacteraceae bacterium]
MLGLPFLRVAPFLAGTLVTAALLALPVHPSAQEARGTISGTVRDTSGGVIPGASITVTHEAMGTSSVVLSSDRGFFQAPYLIPGTYEVVVELDGFKRHAREGLQVRVNDTLQLDVVLEVGSAEEEVTVTAQTPLLETTSASIGQVVDSRRVAELPTPHGDPFALIGVAGGVSSMGAQRLDRPFEPTHIVGYAMAGTRSNRSDITIDGVPATSTANAGEVIASYVPPQDLVQEFKVQTATFDAQFGNTEGGVTNLSLKSGTNELHGTAYFTKMPADLFANDFFANANDIPLPDFSYNRWGGTAGGPILRQRTFFMYGYEGIDEARPRNNGTPAVPTEKMRNGDFSALLALGPEYQIHNPFTRRPAGNGRYEQDPFPDNIIPRE